MYGTFPRPKELPTTFAKIALHIADDAVKRSRLRHFPRRQVAIASMLGAERHVGREMAGRSAARLSESYGSEQST